MKLIIVFTLLFATMVAFGQNEDVIHGLNATEFNGKVLVSWAIKQGNTCNGVQVLRSSDSVNFTQIGSIEGICGSTAEEIQYSFTDLNPIVNSVNYYRLSLGGVGFSWIISTEVIDVGETNYLLSPNPITEESTLYFNNDSGKLLTISFYNVHGKLSTELFTTSESQRLNEINLESGLYYFTITENNSDSVVKGKLLVP